MNEHEQGDAEQTGDMGESAKAYAELGEQPKASEFYQELANSAAAVPELSQSILARTQSLHDTLLPREEPREKSGFGRPATEKEARAEIGIVVKDALKFLSQPGGVESATLTDLKLGNDFDSIINSEVMAIFGARGKQIGDAVPEQGGRFLTTTYETVIPGVVLERWRHHPSGAITNEPGDFEKISLARK